MPKGRTVRFFIDPATDQPHIFKHDVAEDEVLEILSDPSEDRKGLDGSRVAIGKTASGRFLRVIYAVDPDAVFIITAMELQGKPLLAFRRRRRRK